MDAQNLDIQNQFAEALNFHRAGQIEKAKESYKKLLSLWPHHAESWQNLGILYAQEKDFAQAVDCFKRATEADPLNSNYFSPKFKLICSFKEFKPIEAYNSKFSIIFKHPVLK